MASQLGDPKERALTLLLIPFVHLSSRLPLSYLLIQAVVPGYKLGMFTLRGVVLALTSIVPVLAVCGCYRLSFSLLAHKVKIPDLDTEVAVRTPRWSLVLPDALPRFGSQLVSWVVYSLLASSLVWVLSSRLTPADERSHTHFDNAQLGENAISYLWAFGLDKTTSLAVVSSLISRAAIPSALATSRSIRQRQHEANRRAMVLSEKSWVLGDRAHTNPRATLWSLLALSLFAPFSVVGIVRLSKAHSSVWLPGVYILLSSSLGLLSAFIIRNVCFS
jgi:Fe2+ transport system protein B